jgi:hypothetical protein
VRGPTALLAEKLRVPGYLFYPAEITLDDDPAHVVGFVTIISALALPDCFGHGDLPWL